MLGGADERRAHAPARTRAGGRRSGTTALSVIWGVAGFVLGATLILGVLSVTGSVLPQLSPLWDTHGVQGAGCTSLALDRGNGHTTAEPCRSSTQAQREALAAAPGDLARP